LLGEPNAGKSTLLSVVSAARPKIADYPFTTLEPHLGVVGLPDQRSFVIADIPGIIEGAHAGKGLGLRFLQHVERTRLVAVLIPADSSDPQATYDLLRREAALYGTELAAKPHVVVVTKMDLLPPGAPPPAIHTVDDAPIIPISAVTGAGLPHLLESLWQRLRTPAPTT
jgi:GTP-binding protein